VQIRNFFNDWDPIPGSPDDEYDCVVDGVVTALHRGASAEELAHLISSKFAEHIGMPVQFVEVVDISERIRAWWNSYGSGDPHA